MSCKLIQAIGAGFDLQKSSCGSNQPKYFKWSDKDQKTKIFIDHSIQYSGENKDRDNCYGWTSESKAIIHNVFDYIINNLDLCKKKFNKIFTYDENLISLDKEFFCYSPAGSNIPWTPVEDFGIHKKTKLISFLCSSNSMTPGHMYRLSWAERLKDKVDMYGGACGSQIIGGHYYYHHRKKTEAMNDYMFSITIENNNTDCYFTEKITDCFVNGVVPIYYGSKNIVKHFNQNGIIFLEEDFDISYISPELYYSKMEAIEDNFVRAKEMTMADDYMFLLTN